MPIYEYQCRVCHHQFDLIQKISDEPVKTCPQCFKETAVRLISAPGFQLKGTGWYATDYKNPTNAKQDTSKNPEAPVAPSSSEPGGSSSTSTKKGETT